MFYEGLLLLDTVLEDTGVLKPKNALLPYYENTWLANRAGFGSANLKGDKII